MFKLFLIASVIIGSSFLGIAIKMFFIKGATFKKTCGSVDPSTGKTIPCTCGGKEDDSCDNTPQNLEISVKKGH